MTKYRLVPCRTTGLFELEVYKGFWNGGWAFVGFIEGQGHTAIVARIRRHQEKERAGRKQAHTRVRYFSTTLLLDNGVVNLTIREDTGQSELLSDDPLTS